MRVAEVKINAQVVFRTNDREHLAFTDACKENDENMARLYRDFERAYVAKHRRKKDK